jgi:hypothetical protein
MQRTRTELRREEAVDAARSARAVAIAGIKEFQLYGLLACTLASSATSSRVCMAALRSARSLTTCRMERTPCALQHATCNQRRTTQRATRNLHNLRRATGNMQRAAQSG